MALLALRPLHRCAFGSALRECSNALRRSGPVVNGGCASAARFAVSASALAPVPQKGTLLKLFDDLDFRAKRILAVTEPKLRRAKVVDLEKQSLEPTFWDSQLNAQTVLQVPRPQSIDSGCVGSLYSLSSASAFTHLCSPPVTPQKQQPTHPLPSHSPRDRALSFTFSFSVRASNSTRRKRSSRRSSPFFSFTRSLRRRWSSWQRAVPTRTFSRSPPR